MAGEIIIVSGFTAAGKTTHSRLIADELGWQYLGMSQIRTRLVAMSSSAEQEWLPEGDRRRASDADLDRKMDRKMAACIAVAGGPVVVDAWLQPWLCRTPGAVRIWLHSSFTSRVAKAQVSRLRAGLAPTPEISAQIAAKDQFSSRHFHRLYGVRFGPDPDLFDVVLDNSSFITEASIPASDTGISAFQPVFSSSARSLVRARENV